MEGNMQKDSNTQVTPELQKQIDEARKQANGNEPQVIIINNNQPSELDQALTGQVKNKWIAFLLCFFLGGIGAHQFYAGWTKRGIAMLLLTLTLIGGLISGPWALINLIQILIGNFKTKDGTML